MCRCCQSCLEDCYWYCIEERFCFDKDIVNYNADEDEYLTKRNGKAFHEATIEVTDRPICEQPGRQENVLSSKIREEDYRQIQTNVPFLAPEILAVFQNSQIFHDHQPSKSLAIVHKSPSHKDDGRRHSRTNSANEKILLKRLEGFDINSYDTTQSTEDVNNELILCPVPMIKTSTATLSDKLESSNEAIREDEQNSNGASLKTPVLNKRLRAIQSLPYFSFRPASETDIFTIAGSSRISMTPEIPSISYTTLPKYYEDTPTVEKYKESTSLYSIQTSNQERARDFDFSMPRYFGKSDLIAKSVDNLATHSRPQASTAPKKTEKSKRLKLLRANLPPLSIHINKEKSRERKIE